MKLGIEVLLSDKILQKKLEGKRIAYLGHPASICSTGQHGLDALVDNGLRLSSAFGPQHGMRGDKQDNMVESDDYQDPKHRIPVFSLYGKTRRPTQKMLDSFDVLLFDLQDVGTRIYTYLTTLLYILEAGAKNQKSIWVLDRPNPAGRSIEGLRLEKGQESFVGASTFPIRHGLTMGEAAGWFRKYHTIDVDLTVVRMEGYDSDRAPGWGWPQGEIPFVNPSPNLSSLNGIRCFSGTVLLEGTELSEGRGTSTPLEIIGHPEIKTTQLLEKMSFLEKEGHTKWLEGALIRPCFFEPTFHKHKNQLCQGFQLHTDTNAYDPINFKPYRLIALTLKALRLLQPKLKIWREFDYEYEPGRLAIDIINGGPSLRNWVDDRQSSTKDFELKLAADEFSWKNEIKEFIAY